MFTVTVTEKGGSVTVRELDQPEVTIGRIQGNDIVLPKSNISKRHARIINNGGSFVVIDSKSTNGTYINGKRIDAPYDLRVGDKIYVGDFTLEVEFVPNKRGRAKSRPPPPPAKPQEPPDRDSAEEILSDDEWGVGSDLNQEWADDWADEPVEEMGPTDASHSRRATALDEKSKRRPGPTTSGPQLKRATKKDTTSEPASPEADLERALRKIHQRLLRLLELWRTEVKQLDDHQLSERTRQSIEEIVGAMRADGELPPSVDAGALIDKVLEESLGLGPIADLLDDNSITEIMVNNAQQVFVERDGKLELSDRTFSSDIAVRGLIERIVASIGHRVDESSPMVDARLDNGSRVSAIIPPLSIKGPTLTIRKLTREPLSVDDLVASGTLTADMAEFLELCIKARRNILIAGGTGSGKTTTLNVLANCVPDSERIITIEETAELKLEQAHVVSLEARPPNSEGKGAIAIRDLIRAALRMRPDRIVIGESRGGETLDMLQAMSTGHEGSLTTMHANSPHDALSRLETMVLMSGMDLPSRAIRDQIASAINIIVQQARFSDGSRRITHISEITGVEQDTVRMQEIFVFEHEGFGTTGRVSGRHRPTGSVPSFYETLDAMGIPASVGMFQFQE